MKVKLIQRNQFPRRRVIRVQIHHQKHQKLFQMMNLRKKIRPEVVPSHEIGVTFDDISALDDIKESLQELVMLPLQRPDLFKSGLLKPCRGILLFGPPSTGKTMLAKAIAKEARTSFINVSVSTITSKLFGEDEKNARALFTLAAKISPCIIFVDEVDGMLGQCSREGEHEAMRKIKNEFMTHWDGLLTKTNERILVLEATNRPFDLDLDEAIIRRFERRIMVGLRSLENRELILETLLSKENVEGLDYKELATMTEGYTGSDLKNLCLTAAYHPVRELIQKERIKELERKLKAEEGKGPIEASRNREENEDPTIALPPLNMEDLKLAKNQSPSTKPTLTLCPINRPPATPNNQPLLLLPPQGQNRRSKEKNGWAFKGIWWAFLWFSRRSCEQLELITIVCCESVRGIQKQHTGVWNSPNSPHAVWNSDFNSEKTHGCVDLFTHM